MNAPATEPGSEAPAPRETEVLVVGGGPVGLAAAVELGRRGIACVVVEPRTSVSRARPRCKTVNVRTMEHLRRWGLAERLRERSPIPVSWSTEIVFCTALAGHELSRFSGVLGLRLDGDRFPEAGQQSPQYVLEDLLREAVRELESSTLVTGSRVTSLRQTADHVAAEICDADGNSSTIVAQYAVGCDGSRSVVRDAIGSSYVGARSLRPNFGMVFNAPTLAGHIRHGPAVQYWIVNDAAPALMGPLDLDGNWWLIAFNVDQARGEASGREIIDAVAGVPVPATVLATDPWTARMEIVDRARAGRVFLAGDAAHLNPPFGGHGLNTGIGDAVDLGWKLAAVLEGWADPRLLDSYEADRRPVQTQVIAAAEANMRVLADDLLTGDLDASGDAGELNRRQADARIQATKHAEFHALDLVLDLAYEDSPLNQPDPERIDVGRDGGARLGALLPHAWLGDGRSLYDELGSGFTLVALTDVATAAVQTLTRAAQTCSVPLTVVRVEPDLRRKTAAGLVLVRPDQHVVWVGERPPDDPNALFERVRGVA